MSQNQEDKIRLPQKLNVELKLRGKTQLVCCQNDTDMMQAYWCRLLCQWYQAVDGTGLSISKLVEYVMELRNYLLQFYRSGSFKTPSAPLVGLP